MNLKVNLTIAGQALNGYLNIDPLANPKDEDKIATDISNIDSFVDHNSAELLLALDVLDFFPLQVRQSVLINYMCKIAHGGSLIVGGLDIREIGRALFYQNLDLRREANLHLFGPCDHVMRSKKSLITMDDTVEMIMNPGQFEIQSKKFDGMHYLVEAKRN
jgi:hypothetical protein